MANPRALDFLQGHSETTAKLAVDQLVTVTDMSRRNENTMVVGRGTSGYFVKHGADWHRRRTVADEYRNIQFLSRAAHPDLSAAIPPIIAHDPEGGWLATRLIRDGATFRNAVRPRRTVLVGASRRVGSLAGALHASSFQAADVEQLGTQPPGVGRFLRPSGAAYAEFSPATITFLTAVQSSPVFGESLRSLKSLWQPTSLLHGDLRWDNIVLSVPDGDERAAGRVVRVKSLSRVWLIDWEFLQVGDPHWDLACFIAEIVWYWLASLPTDAERPPDVSSAARPIASQQPAIAAFLAGHRAAYPDFASRFDCCQLVVWLAMRLLGGVYERTQRQRKIDRTCVLALQLAENLLHEPSAGVALLGLEQ